jgi:spore maturation protein CgeB
VVVYGGVLGAKFRRQGYKKARAVDIKQRDEFEPPMSGALYCTSHMDEVTRFFKPRHEIVTYRNEEELLSSVRRLLDHPVGPSAAVAPGSG